MRSSLDIAVRSVRGVSIVEVTIALALVMVLGSLGVGSLLAWRADARALGAARYLAARLLEQRAAAVRRGTSGGFLIATAGARTTLQPVVDGNGNGLRAADVGAGIDRLLDTPVAVEDLFPGVRFAVCRPVPPIDGEGSGLAEGSDPVRIGGSRFVSFAAAGTGTSGTFYLANGECRQLAVRVFGTTGRVRVFEFRVADGSWNPR